MITPSKVENIHPDFVYPRTLLQTQCSTTIGYVLSFYVLILALVKQNSQSCNELEFAQWTNIVHSMCTGGCLTLLLRSTIFYIDAVISKSEDNAKDVSLLLGTLLFVQSSTHILTIVGYDGICRDPFDVKISMMQWIEWQITVPLIMYVLIILDSQKKHLTFNDSVIIILAGLGILLPLINNFGLSFEYASINILLSGVFIVIALSMLTWQAKVGYQNTLSSNTLMENLTYNQIFIRNVAAFKYKCTILMFILFQVFPLIYFLDHFNVISSDFQHVAIVILSYFVKTYLCTSIMDFHLKLLDPNTHILNYEKQANESRRAYLRYVFHEVRVPLNSICMGLHVLNGSNELSAGDKETLIMMKEATLFMTATLNDVLSIQKIEQGKLELILLKTSLKGLVSRVKSSLKGLLVSNEITLTSSIDPDVPKNVLIDKHRIEHVIANLVSNACKFSPKNATVIIEIKKGDVDNELVISVTDQGVGLTTEEIGKLFIAFSQIRASELQEGRGSGVGLAICKEVVELHGGKINVKSIKKGENTTNHGSTFYFTLKYQESDQDDESVDNIDDGDKNFYDENEKKSDADKIASWKFLVVDDVQSNRKILAMLLQKRGISCDQAEDGVQALEKVSKCKYDVIITDQIMPNMNGMDLAKELRKIKYSKIVVGLTGNALDEDVNEFIEAGVDLVLTKPLKLNQLGNLIQFILVYGNESVQKDLRIEEKSKIASERLILLRQIN